MLLRWHHLLSYFTLAIFLVAQGLLATHDLWCECHQPDRADDPSSPPSHSCPCDCVLSGFATVVCEQPALPPAVLVPTFDRCLAQGPALYMSPSLDHLVPPPRG